MEEGGNELHHNFTQLRKAAASYTAAEGDYRLAILGNSATQMLSAAVTGMGVLHNLRIHVLDTDYNQIQLQAFDQNSELYRFQPNGVLLFMCTRKLFEDYCRFTGDRKHFANAKMQEIAEIQDKIYERSRAGIFQLTFMTENDLIFGNFGLKQKSSFVYQLRRLNLLLMERAAEHSFLYLIDIDHIRSVVGTGFLDRKLYDTAKMAVSLNGLPELAYHVVKMIQSQCGVQKKCVICDLDNTLWGGVIGDDGIGGIEIGEHGTGPAYTEFQLWLKELKKRGILLCICSKNEEQIAKKAFCEHPDMVLRLEDITVFVANWDDKAANIRRIREMLNIGLDSMVFIDDNPFERELVRKLLPEVTVPEMPEDVSCFCSYLRSLDLFESAAISETDANRTEQYRSEFQRNQLMTNTTDLDSYLQSLEMKATYHSFDEQSYARIAQLTQRSNQFHLRSIRYSESDIEQIAKNDNYLTLYFTLKDQFGGYGIVAVVILEKQEQAVFVDTLLMSCRVLKRGMEEFLFNTIVETVQNAGYACIEAEYLPTPKNRMVQDLYPRFGFQEISDGKYRLLCEQYTPQKTFIADDTKQK